jgi:hypothetical protein
MKIHISNSGSARLEEADDFKGFAVLAQGPASNAAAMAKGLPAGISLEGDSHAWVGVDWLKSALDIPARADRAENFEKMLAYARSKGWTKGDPEAVRAHIEWA